MVFIFHLHLVYLSSTLALILLIQNIVSGSITFQCIPIVFLFVFSWYVNHTIFFQRVVGMWWNLKITWKIKQKVDFFEFCNLIWYSYFIKYGYWYNYPILRVYNTTYPFIVIFMSWKLEHCIFYSIFSTFFKITLFYSCFDSPPFNILHETLFISSPSFIAVSDSCDLS